MKEMNYYTVQFFESEYSVEPFAKEVYRGSMQYVEECAMAYMVKGEYAMIFCPDGEVKNLIKKA